MDDIAVDLERQTVRLYGVNYDLALFRGLGMLPVGAVVEIIARTDGVVALRRRDLTGAAQPGPGLEG